VWMGIFLWDLHLQAWFPLHTYDARHDKESLFVLASSLWLSRPPLWMEFQISSLEVELRSRDGAQCMRK